MSDNEKRLGSWKDIAKHLDRDVSTVMRWARESGLPVYRVPAGRKNARVFAYKEELDFWLKDPRSGPSPAQAVDSQRATVTKNRLPALASAFSVFVVAVVLVLFAVNRPGPPGLVTFSGNKILAWDQTNRLCWEYAFPQAVRVFPPDQIDKRVRITDLDGDGRTEFLVVMVFAGDAEVFGTEVYCFSNDGKLLWKYRPDLTLSFAGRQFGGPWYLSDFLVVPGRKSKNVWVAATHHTQWPAFITKIDPRGQATVQFVNSGGIYALSNAENGSGSYVLAAGVNNEYEGAALAVLKENQPSAVSPQIPGSPFKCDSCPDSRPYRYFIFPRTELNTIKSGAPYNWSYGVAIYQNVIEVQVLEVPPSVATIYEFSPDFKLQALSMSSGYRQLHAQLEKDGRLKHTTAQCPDQTQPMKVRMFDPGRGWVELQIRAAPFKS